MPFRAIYDHKEPPRATLSLCNKAKNKATSPEKYNAAPGIGSRVFKERDPVFSRGVDVRGAAVGGICPTRNAGPQRPGGKRFHECLWP